MIVTNSDGSYLKPVNYKSKLGSQIKVYLLFFSIYFINNKNIKTFSRKNIILVRIWYS